MAHQRKCKPAASRFASSTHGQRKYYVSGLVIQALRHLGKDNVDRKVIDLLRQRLPAKEKANLVKDTRYGTDWIFQVAQEVAEGRR